MPHPGFFFARRSYSTFSKLACPRAAYLNQMLGVRLAPKVDNKLPGALAAGSVFHTLCEVYYTPPVFRDQPLRGTDGSPVLQSTDDVLEWYADRAEAKAIDEARESFDAYCEHHRRMRDGGALAVIGLPEVDVNAIVSYGGQESRYETQADLIVALGDGSVAAVEHKLLSTASRFVLDRYTMSGQMVGHALAWNSRSDLVARHGPMTSVVLNIAFKKGRTRAHRESIFVPHGVQRQYAQSVVALGQKVDALLTAHHKARPGAARAAVWPKLGHVLGLCDGVGGKCDYRHVCHTHSDVVSPLYQITEAGRKRAEQDGCVKVDPLTPEWRADPPAARPIERAVQMSEWGSTTDPEMAAFFNQSSNGD